MNNERQRIKADLKLEELKDKAREWDILAKENLELRKEIERLNKRIKELEEKQDKLNKVIKLVRDYEELEQIIGIGKPPFQLYKLQEILKGSE